MRDSTLRAGYCGGQPVGHLRATYFFRGASYVLSGLRCHSIAGTFLEIINPDSLDISINFGMVILYSDVDNFIGYGFTEKAKSVLFFGDAVLAVMVDGCGSFGQLVLPPGLLFP